MRENPNADAETVEWMCSALAERLESEGAQDLAKKIRACGEPIGLVCTACGHHKLGHTQCKARWCPRCQRSISAKRFHRFQSAAHRMQWPLSIMLSHENEDSAAKVFSTLMPAFKRFRRTKLWKQNVRGGVVSYEVTNRFGSWHDHLHCLVDCRWLALTAPEPKRGEDLKTVRKKLRAAKHELTEAWAGCLGQETAVTWVDRANAGRLMEHIKYTVKGSDLLKCTGRIAPLLRALKGRRLVQPFGNCYDLGSAWKQDDDSMKQECRCEACHQQSTYLPEFVVGAELASMRKGRSSRVFGKASS
jgi:predicted Zn-ribbon and HTH transcriptional regulator